MARLVSPHCPRAAKKGTRYRRRFGDPRPNVVKLTGVRREITVQFPSINKMKKGPAARTAFAGPVALSTTDRNTARLRQPKWWRVAGDIFGERVRKHLPGSIESY